MGEEAGAASSGGVAEGFLCCGYGLRIEDARKGRGVG